MIYSYDVDINSLIIHHEHVLSCTLKLEIVHKRNEIGRFIIHEL